jgi:hypothetical protein
MRIRKAYLRPALYKIAEARRRQCPTSLGLSVPK